MLAEHVDPDEAKCGNAEAKYGNGGLGLAQGQGKGRESMSTWIGGSGRSVSKVISKVRVRVRVRVFNDILGLSVRPMIPVS